VSIRWPPSNRPPVPPSLRPFLPGIAVDPLLEPTQENLARQVKGPEHLVVERLRERRRGDVARLLQQGGGEMAEVQEGL